MRREKNNFSGCMSQAWKIILDVLEWGLLVHGRYTNAKCVRVDRLYTFALVFKLVLFV